MKKNTTLICGLTLCLLAFASCKKKADGSPKAKLCGKWKMTQYAADGNHNNVMDGSEVQLPGDTVSMYITFISDGTGSENVNYMGLAMSPAFTWALINNDADVHVKYTSGSNAGDEIDEHIVNLSGTDATFSDVQSIGGVSTTTWTIFKKQ